MFTQRPGFLVAKSTIRKPMPGTAVAVIGLGRVGLPLALSFAAKGLRVIGVERDKRVRAMLSERRMPFHEPGCDELLRAEKLEVVADINDVHPDDAPDYVVITVGTPLQAHIEVDLAQIGAVTE